MVQLLDLGVSHERFTSRGGVFALCQETTPRRQ
jgi:hypothetical protein